MKSGIYAIRNITTNQYYVGSSFNIKKRWRDHRWHLNHNKHHNSYLQNAWNKYKPEAFEFIILLLTDFDILENERNLIAEYSANYTNGGYNFNDPKEIRFNKCSDEKKELHSQRMIGDKNPMFNKTGINHPKFRYSLSNESRKIVSSKRKLYFGEKSSNAKLTENQVKEIRLKYIPRVYSTTQLANEYNVSQGTIMNIIKKRGWTHI